jgi:hypothetical protein
MAKVIPIIKFTKRNKLSPLMVKTLRAACKKQTNHERLGQIDLDGSFTSLLKRELIDVKTITINGKREVSWYVTREGINTLISLGFNDPCELRNTV